MEFVDALDGPIELRPKPFGDCDVHGSADPSNYICTSREKS